MSTRANTPDLLGYLVAVLISIGSTTVGIAASLVPDEGLLEGLYWLYPAVFYTGVLALVAAPVGVVLVHYSCRRVQVQCIHVLAAGLAGILTGLVFVLLTEGGTEWAYSAYLTGLLGVATAIGRAAVIPMVRGRS